MLTPSQVDQMEKRGNSGNVYQILLPTERLSQAIMLWNHHNQPCNLGIHDSKSREDCSVLQLRNDIVATEIIDLVKDAQLKIIKVESKQPYSITL